MSGGQESRIPDHRFRERNSTDNVAIQYILPPSLHMSENPFRVRSFICLHSLGCRFAPTQGWN